MSYWKKSLKRGISFKIYLISAVWCRSLFYNLKISQLGGEIIGMVKENEIFGLKVYFNFDSLVGLWLLLRFAPSTIGPNPHRPSLLFFGSWKIWMILAACHLVGISIHLQSENKRQNWLVKLFDVEKFFRLKWMKKKYLQENTF